jgi:hypothetical protein
MRTAIWLAAVAPAAPPEFPWWLTFLAVGLSLALAFMSGLLLGLHWGERRGIYLGELSRGLGQVPEKVVPKGVKGDSQWWRSS